MLQINNKYNKHKCSIFFPKKLFTPFTFFNNDNFAKVICISLYVASTNNN